MEAQGLSKLFLDYTYNTKEDLLLTNFWCCFLHWPAPQRRFLVSLESHPKQPKCDGSPSRCLWLQISHCVSALLNWGGALGSQNPCWEMSAVEEGWACLVGGGRTGKSKLCLSCALASTAWDLREFNNQAFHTNTEDNTSDFIWMSLLKKRIWFFALCLWCY